LKDIPISECYESLLNEEFPKKEVNKCNVNMTVNIDVNSKYNCKNCGKGFNMRQGKYQHEKKCRIRKDDNDEVEDVVSKLNQTPILSNCNNNTINSNNTTFNTKINNTNIIINPFGNENVEYITSNMVQELIKCGPYTCIPELLKKIHFNPEHMENFNITIPNKKQPFVKVYNGKEWLLTDKKEALEQMGDNAYDIALEHYDEKVDYMEKFIDKYNSGNLTKKLIKESELTILNNQAKLLELSKNSQNTKN